MGANHDEDLNIVEAGCAEDGEAALALSQAAPGRGCCPRGRPPRAPLVQRGTCAGGQHKRGRKCRNSAVRARSQEVNSQRDKGKRKSAAALQPKPAPFALLDAAALPSAPRQFEAPVLVQDGVPAPFIATKTALSSLLTSHFYLFYSEL